MDDVLRASVSPATPPGVDSFLENSGSSSSFSAGRAQSDPNEFGSLKIGGDKEKGTSEEQVPLSEVVVQSSRDRRPSAEFQSAKLVPLLASPTSSSGRNGTDLLLANWNESPFLSAHQGNDAEGQGQDDEVEKYLSFGSPWHIDINKVEVGGMVASGSFGTVYKGLYKDVKVAVKMLMIPESLSMKESQKLKSRFRKKISVWYTLDHPNIVKFVGAYINPPRWIIISEFLQGGCLRAYLYQQKKLPEKIIQTMALDIARGMEYLHQNNVMHRDLKSANLLLDESGRVKVADFGLARFDSHEAGNLTAETGTIRWMAPEVICHKPYNRKVDVYSFGIVLWELCTSKLPFEGMSFVQLAHAVSSDNHRPPISEVTSASFAKLIARCWDKDPSRRPEFREIVQYLETGYVSSLDPISKSKYFLTSSRSTKKKDDDKYGRPTNSMHGGRVVRRAMNAGPASVIDNNDEITDEEEWRNVTRECACRIM
ncbi:hypothetical protein R1sor_011409 [Riccia sorocarpa]|uniref:Protein kinase domain-containing protein n=1 Tax=Riccia sorocarpa TaxID=122646 RepID=A0ABD3I0U3_9MARC